MFLDDELKAVVCAVPGHKLLFSPLKIGVSRLRNGYRAGHCLVSYIYSKHKSLPNSRRSPRPLINWAWRLF
uniref:Uncharacterized protein n=1 Tax=Anguilla anguilla TaxID=7936 RepID=A0A0E9SMV4_ANGAN